MPPYFFRTGPNEAERIMAGSPEGSAKIYATFEAQNWMRGAMEDTGDEDKDPDTTSLDFLANEVVDATLAGDTLMCVEADSREALQQLALAANVKIQPLN
jgi:hypothetical protein